MRLDRKFLLIAPTLVLALIVAGMFYTATRLRQIIQASDNWQTRSDYVAALEHGQRHITNQKPVESARLWLDAEHLQSDAIESARELILTLGGMTLVCCMVLIWTIRGVPRTLPLRGPVLFRTSP